MLSHQSLSRQMQFHPKIGPSKEIDKTHICLMSHTFLIGCNKHICTSFERPVSTRHGFLVFYTLIQNVSGNMAFSSMRSFGQNLLRNSLCKGESKWSRYGCHLGV